MLIGISEALKEAVTADSGKVTRTDWRRDKIAALAARARAGKLLPDEYTGATFTVSNLGMFGVTSLTPIINPPAACILGVGAIEEKPVVISGQLAVGHTLSCTLATDHRAIDGATGAEFMATLRARLEEPFSLTLEG